MLNPPSVCADIYIVPHDTAQVYMLYVYICGLCGLYAVCMGVCWVACMCYVAIVCVVLLSDIQSHGHADI